MAGEVTLEESEVSVSGLVSTIAEEVSQEALQADLTALPEVVAFINTLPASEQPAYTEYAMHLLRAIREQEIAVGFISSGMTFVPSVSGPDVSPLERVGERVQSLGDLGTQLQNYVTRGTADAASGMGDGFELAYDAANVTHAIWSDGASLAKEGEFIDLSEYRETLLLGALRGIRSTEPSNGLESLLQAAKNVWNHIWHGGAHFFTQLFAGEWDQLFDFSGISAEVETESVRAEMVGIRASVADALLVRNEGLPEGERIAEGVAYELAERLGGVDEHRRMRRMPPHITLSSTLASVVQARVNRNNELYDDDFRTPIAVEEMMDTFEEIGSELAASSFQQRFLHLMLITGTLRAIPVINHGAAALDPYNIGRAVTGRMAGLNGRVGVHAEFRETVRTATANAAAERTRIETDYAEQRERLLREGGLSGDRLAEIRAQEAAALQGVDERLAASIEVAEQQRAGLRAPAGETYDIRGTSADAAVRRLQSDVTQQRVLIDRLIEENRRLSRQNEPWTRRLGRYAAGTTRQAFLTSVLIEAGIYVYQGGDWVVGAFVSEAQAAEIDAKMLAEFPEIEAELAVAPVIATPPIECDAAHGADPTTFDDDMLSILMGTLDGSATDARDCEETTLMIPPTTTQLGAVANGITTKRIRYDG